MKKVLAAVLFTTALFAGSTAQAQGNPDKSKRPSPPALAKATLASGAVISIDYSQPSVKGRAIGKDLEPKEGQVWRTGANEATVFETTKDVMVEGKVLPAGKYSLFTIAGKDSWTIIFNKTWKQWGAYDYKQADDVLRVNVQPSTATPFAEKMTFDISEAGVVTLLWGDHKVSFTVK